MTLKSGYRCLRNDALLSVRAACASAYSCRKSYVTSINSLAPELFF
jgi:hypothetical protein